MGNVIAAGLGQNPARQAAIFAGLPDSVGALTVNKVCGSGLKAVMLADQAIRAGEASLVVAGGMESMSRAPYLLTKAREGYRLGHGELLDSMILDGLWDVYGRKHMGSCGETCAAKYQFSRTEQDDFAVRSHTRARQAIADGIFETEIVPVEVSSKGKTTRVSVDEGPAKFDEGETAVAEARVYAGRDDHRRKCLEHQRRSRRGPRCVARALPRREAQADRRHQGCRNLEPATRMVHHRTGRRHRAAACKDRLENRAGRPF